MRKIWLLLMMVAPVPLLADTIYAWGYGEMFVQILLAVSSFANDGYLIKVAGGLGMLALVFKLFDGRSAPILELGKYFMLMVLVYVAFLTAGTGGVYRHTIEDRVTGYTNVVDGVPVGVGKMLALVTGMELSMSRAMESRFSTPTSTQFRNAGLGFPLVAHANMSKMHSINPFVQKTMDDYIMNCLLFDMMDGTLDPNTVSTSPNLLSTITSTSTRMTNIYTAANPGGELKTCAQASVALPLAIDAMLPQVKQVVSAQSGLITGGSTAVFDTKAADVAQLYFGISKSATDYLKQSVTMNMLSDGMYNVAKVSGIDPTALAYGTTIAERAAQSNFTIQGELAKKYLPLLKGILTLLIVSIGWMLAVFAVMFFDVAYLRMYVSLLIFLSLWTPLAVVLNFITSLYLQKTITPIGNVAGWYTMANKAVIDSEVTSALAWLGYLGWSIPMLAYAIAKKSDHGLVSLTSSLTSAMGSGAGQVSGELARGNINAGVVRYGKKEAYDNGYSASIDEKGFTQTQALSVGGHNMQASRTIQPNGTEMTSYTDNVTGNSAAVDGSGDIAAVRLPQMNASFALGARSAVAKQLTENEAKSEGIVEAASHTVAGKLAESFSQKDSTGKGAKTATTSAQQTALQQTFAQSVEDTLMKDEKLMDSIAEKLGVTASVGADGKVAPGNRRQMAKDIAKKAIVSAAGDISFGGSIGTDTTHQITLDHQTNDKIMKSVAKSTLENFGTNKEVSNSFTTGKDHSEGTESSDVYQRMQQLSTQYTKTQQESNALNAEMNTGITLNQDRGVAMLNAATHAAMLENEMQTLRREGTADGLSDNELRAKAEQNVGDRVQRQGGHYTGDQVLHGLAYLSDAHLEANAGDASKMGNLYNRALHPERMLGGLQLKEPGSFKPIGSEVDDKLQGAQPLKRDIDQNIEKITEESKQHTGAEAGIRQVQRAINQDKNEVEAAKVPGHGAQISNEVLGGIAKKASSLDSHWDTAKALAGGSTAAAAVYNLLTGLEKPDELGKKLEGHSEDAERKAKDAKKNLDETKNKTEKVHAQDRLSKLIDDRREGMTPDQRKEAEELKDQIREGKKPLSKEQFERVGLSDKDLTENGIRFDAKDGSGRQFIDMAESGKNVKTETLKAAQASFDSADTMARAAKDTLDLHRKNPNVGADDLKNMSKIAQHIPRAGALSLVIGAASVGYIWDTNQDIGTNFKNVAKAMDPTMGGAEAVEASWNKSGGDTQEFLRNLPKNYAVAFLNMFPDMNKPKTSAELHADEIKPVPPPSNGFAPVQLPAREGK